MKRNKKLGHHAMLRLAVNRFCILTMICALFAAVPVTVQAKTYNQSGYALKKYDTGKFKILKNNNFGKKDVKSNQFIVYDVGEITPHKLTFSKGNKKPSISTWTYLPKNFEAPGDMGNPQAIAVTPDGKYAYITYPKSGSSSTCRIIRYDLQKLASLGVNTSGNMDDLRSAVNQVFNKKELTDREREIYNCMKIGPWVTLGHGAAFAYNPKDKHLWFTTKTGKLKTDLQRINMSTLKPDLKINFKMYGTVAMGNNITFDKKGNLYYFSYAGKSAWTPKGLIKIYKGKINLKAKKKVTFNLVMQGVRYAVSTGIQSAGYNPKSNRIYLVSNSGLMSFPVSKLGKMKKKDVWSVIFKENREFEGISFDNNGNGYLLINKQPEIMKVSGI